MNSIKANYRTLYGKSLADAVKSETAGDLENVLVAIIGKWSAILEFILT